jgi:hypothetical protein
VYDSLSFAFTNDDDQKEIDFKFVFQVASYDPDFTQYYSRTTNKPEGTELCNELESMLTDCLRHYKKVNAAYPNRVFFYR